MSLAISKKDPNQKEFIAYLKEVVEFSKKIGKFSELRRNFMFLATYAYHSDESRDKKRPPTICRIFRDFAPNSFYFEMQCLNTLGTDHRFWFNGGLIFHSDYKGNERLETGSWSVHT